MNPIRTSRHPLQFNMHSTLKLYVILPATLLLTGCCHAPESNKSQQSIIKSEQHNDGSVVIEAESERTKIPKQLSAPPF